MYVCISVGVGAHGFIRKLPGCSSVQCLFLFFSLIGGQHNAAILRVFSVYEDTQDVENYYTLPKRIWFLWVPTGCGLVALFRGRMQRISFRLSDFFL